MYGCVIDCGTSKIRCSVVKREDVVSCSTLRVGAGDAASQGDPMLLRRAMRQCIEQSIEEAGLQQDAVSWFVTFGLSTSEIGLMEVPHLVAPVGPRDIAGSIRSAHFEDVAPGTFYLIPGVRNRANLMRIKDGSIGEIDSMRGEETQTIGAITSMQLPLPCVLLFLGSHTKLVQVDVHGRIVFGVTTLSGQLFQALTRHTIVATAVPCTVDESASLDPEESEALMHGYRLEREYGFLRAAVMPRCLYNLADTSSAERMAFVEGLLAASDMECIEHYLTPSMSPCPMVIIGQPRRARIYRRLLLSDFGQYLSAVRVLTPEEANQVGVYGALELLSYHRGTTESTDKAGSALH